MNALYSVGASTIRKYTYNVCAVLFNGDKLFSVYVHTPIGVLLEIDYSTSLNDFVTSKVYNKFVV
jgi:hypothetical protein